MQISLVMRVSSRVFLMVSWAVSPPWRWAVAYMSVLVGFAIIYTLLPSGAFRQPEARFDGNVVATERKIARHVRELLKTRWQQKGLAEVTGMEDDFEWRPLLEKLEVKIAGYDETYIHLRIDVPIGIPDAAKGKLKPGGRGSELRTYVCEFKILRNRGDWKPTRRSDMTGIESPVRFLGGTNASLGNAPWGFDFRHFFDYDTVNIAYSTGYPERALVLDEATVVLLTEHVRALEGFPHTFSGSFTRMLYLSVVVITTLGLGDIVPIADDARACVAIEAILGVVCVGLFLNDLARSYGQPRNSRRDVPVPQ
jgi:hypothetical protein